MCRLNLNTGWTFSEFDYSDSLVKAKNFYGSIWMGQYFTITKSLIAEVSGWASPKTSNLFSSNNATFTLNVGLRQMLLDRKMSIRLSVQDIFNSRNWKGEIKMPTGTIYKAESYWGSRSVWLSLSYYFGKQDIKIRQRKTASEEEQGRSGSGGSSGGQGGGIER